MNRFLVRVESAATLRTKLDPTAPIPKAPEQIPGAHDDWIVESGPVRDEHGPEGRFATCEVMATATVAAYAATAAAASAAVLDHIRHSHDDHPISDLRGWGWLPRCETSVTSVRKDPSLRPAASFAVDARRILAPDVACPLPTDHMFELFRWIVASSSAYKDPHASQNKSMHGMLNGRHASHGAESIATIRSLEDLRERIAFALLGVHPMAAMWREDHGIHPTSRFEIRALAHGARHQSTVPGVGHVEKLDRMLCEALRDVPGRPMAINPNPCHDIPMFAHWMRVAVRANGFDILLAYGDQPPGRIGSRWDLSLASSRAGEPFYETLDRAMKRLAAYAPPAAAETLPRAA